MGAYNQSLEVLPESVELRYRFAWAVHEAGDTERAVRIMSEMLEGDVPAGVRVRVHNMLICGSPIRL